MPEQKTAESPRAGGFRIEATLNGTQKDIVKFLSPLSFLEIAFEKDAVVALNIESRDIQKNPYLFSMVYFYPGRIEAMYSYVPGMSPKKRRLDILKYFFNILTLAHGTYAIDNRQVYQLLESAINDMSEYVTSDYDKLYSYYDNLKKEVKTLQTKVAELSDSNIQLSRENYDLKSANDEMKLKVEKLQVYSDDVLRQKIVEWISEHNGEVNLADFSRVHSVPENRVEQALNSLVTEGYLDLKK
ncbi:MAG TPA: hypothetical protein PLO51_06250 [Candidatus Micrarchaeota archaeon]|nr:hypothetical protein [Candidatus Micrarchaeota archaeon]